MGFNKKSSGPVELIPNAKLDGIVAGSAPKHAVNKQQLDDATGGDGYIALEDVSATTPTVGIAKSASNVLSFYTAASERINIDAQGDINIAGGRGINSSVDTDMWADFTPTDAQNDITAGTGGAISVANYLTTINTDAGGDDFTLASGTTIGQLKKIRLVVDGGGDATITLTGYTSIVMNDANDYVILKWGTAAWYVIENSGCTVNA